MGECADMVLDGYLDWDGGYSGNNRGGYTRHNPEDYNKVFCLFRSWSVSPNKRWALINQYGQHIIAERKLTPEQKINFLSEAANNWIEFKKFVEGKLTWAKSKN